MYKILSTVIAVIGLIGFAAAAQAECSGHMQTTSTDASTVATDNTTTKPILPEQSGG